jgi:hypothetical protein
MMSRRRVGRAGLFYVFRWSNTSRPTICSGVNPLIKEVASAVRSIEGGG